MYQELAGHISYKMSCTPRLRLMFGSEGRYPAGMMRTGPLFPGGIQAIALVLLRLGCAAALLFSVCYGRELAPPLLAYAGAITAGILLVGALTTFAATSAALLIAGVTFISGDPAPWAATLTCIALALLGPGAWSIDALRFGRKVIRIRIADAGGLRN